MKLAWVAVAVAGWAALAAADVSYVEEIVNKGVGPRKTGKRKTTNHVYIKGQRQRVHSLIETSKSGAEALRRRGGTTDGSAILQLDRENLLQIDHTRGTYSRESLPPAGTPDEARPGTLPAAKAAAGPDREMEFRTRILDDTKRVAGIPCRRAAAEMKVQHLDPETGKVRRENRYLYQAWVADDFPGYRDIQRFQELQARKTSYPSLIRSGIGGAPEAIADRESLQEELDALEGFHMQSVLKVFTRQGSKKERKVFELVRTVKSLSNSALPDSLFDVSGELSPTTR